MTYHGHIENGKIVLDKSVPLPAGTPVSVVIELANDADGSALNWLCEHAVDSDACPADLAHQHDHYLYGTPKKEG